MKAFKLIGRMARYIVPYIPWCVLGLVFSALIVFFDALSLWLSATVVKTLFMPSTDEVVHPGGGLSFDNINALLKYWTYAAVKKDNVLDSLKLVCLLMAGSFFLKNVFTYLKDITIKTMNFKIIHDLRDDLYSHVLTMPLSFFARSRVGAIIALIANDVTFIRDSLTKTFGKIFTEPARILVFISLLVVISPKLSLIVLVLFPVCGFFIRKIGKSVRSRSRRVYESMEGMLSVVQETIAGVRVVKMFGMCEAEREKFGRENKRFVRDSIKTQVRSSLSSPLVETIGVFIAVLLIWYGGSRVLTGDSLAAEDFIRFIVILFAMYQPLKALGEVNNKLQEGMAAADRVFSVIDKPGEKLDDSGNVSLPVFENKISFNNLTFRYPETDIDVLKNISFDVNKGMVVAVVGPSGSGKSTLLDLIPGFYKTAAGAIQIDGKDINDIELSSLRKMFGIVAQETILFNDSVLNNISYGDRTKDKAAVEEAARSANAWDFVESLPNGLETVVGERGMTLSGGERQRLAIARAILRDPPILILDEATSALDTENERLVQNAMFRLMENRTVFVVAHRLSTIKHADLILVMENGRIIERGTHSELMELGSRYKDFHDMQFGAASDED